MIEPPFSAKNFSAAAQSYLFTSVYWVVVADEELKVAESEWLLVQFGEKYVWEMLEKLTKMEAEEYLAALSQSRQDVPEVELGVIHADLNKWFLSCAMADGNQSVDEYEVAETLITLAQAAGLKAKPEPPPVPRKELERAQAKRRAERRKRRKNRRLLPGELRMNGMILEEIQQELIAKGEIPYQANRRALRALDINNDVEAGIKELDAMLEGIEPVIDRLTELKEEAEDLAKHATSIRRE